MTRLISKLFVVISASFAFCACSTIGHEYSYISNKPTEWNEKYNTYTYTCGEFEYTIRPGLSFDMSWVSPLPLFPYVFPAYLLKKDTNSQFSRIRISRSIKNKPSKELENVIPIIKLLDNKIIRPSFCEKWTQYKTKYEIEEFSECRYDVLVWDESSYSLSFEGLTNSCQLPSLVFKQQIRKFYTACPPHCPRVYIE